MGQKRITIELTEYQARVVRWAVNRALMVTPASIRGRVFMQKLNEADEIIQEACLGLEEIPLPPALKRTPRVPTKPHMTNPRNMGYGAKVGWRR